MVSPQPPPATADDSSDARISFSGEFPEDEEDFISIVPNSPNPKKDSEFEFLSSLSVNTTQPTMLTADQLFFEGKLLPFQQISLNCNSGDGEAAAMMVMREKEGNKEERRVNWFVDDDPSPRPPSCTVLWKELLRLKKQRKPTLSPSSSSSSSSSSRSFGDLATIDEEKDGSEKSDSHVKRIKKGLERTRSATLRIRPMVNVPICTTQGKNNALPPLFSSIKKERLERLRR